MCGDYRPDLYKLNFFTIVRDEEDVEKVLEQIRAILKYRMEEVNCVRIDLTVPYDSYWDALDFIGEPKLEGEWDGVVRDGKAYDVIPPPDPNEPDGE